VAWEECSVANIEHFNSQTGNPYLDSLIWGGHWIADADDPGGRPQIAYWLADGNDFFGQFTSTWSTAEISNFEIALQLYRNVCNIDFVRVFSEANADIEERLFPGSHPYVHEGALGKHEVPDPDDYFEQLFGYYDNVDPDVINRTQGGLGFLIFIHELGHALGLAHPHDGGGDGQLFPGVTFDRPYDTGDFSLNQGIWTTMSYNEGWNRLPPFPTSYGYQGTPMAFDIAALQVLYGANTTFANGDNIYALPTLNQVGTYWSCIWDTGGTDVISAAGSTKATIINLNDATLQAGDPNAGGFVSWVSGIRGGFTIANGAVIENATGGSGNDTLTGNEVANVLTGNAGADSLVGGLSTDTLDGGTGIDRMVGGGDNDLYSVDVKDDVVTELAGGGDKDTVQSIVTYTLGAEIEILELQGALAIDATGNGLANLLIGNSAANVLDGKAGADTMQGGDGDDSYLVDDSNDTADEAGGSGVDTVKSSAASFTLGLEVENLTLAGAAISGLGNLIANIIIGTTAGNMLSGLAGHDSLSGNNGNDTLDGGADNDTLYGGAGNDNYTGGAGNDLYKVAAGDAIAGADPGTDTVESLITFTLGNEQENLTLAGTAAINGTGNEGDNVLTGNAAANILDGEGGDDDLIGGAGNDTYVVDSLADKATEEDKGGTDLVKSAQTFTLGDFIEKLELTGDSYIDGTGNGLANTITGNKGDNKLLGLGANDTLSGGDGGDTLDGGAGKDAMNGGAGNDTYMVDVLGEVATESSATGGTDTVKSTVSYTLGANVENLVLLAGAASGTGNSLDNTITGNDGANTINGGAGEDELVGLLGNDTYIVDKLGDVIEDTGGIDTVQSSIGFSLAGVVAIENLTLTGSAAISGTGNSSDNVIVGNSAANTLTGDAGSDTLKGGAGADSLIGGMGNDTYVVDTSGDKVDESGGNVADVDTVQSSLSFNLNANGTTVKGEIENLTLTGTAAISGTGNGLDNDILGNIAANALIGNSGDDTLTGGSGNDTLTGGAGVDQLAGGAGNDTYVIEDVLDQVIESLTDGIDTVLSNLDSYTLDDNIEYLTLTGPALEGVGNAADNKITGTIDSNLLDGGLGADTMIGGADDDDYVVDNPLDVIVESASLIDVFDSVTSSVSYTLAANVEFLFLSGTEDINGTGNAQTNVLHGNSGNNILNGMGGHDSMVGGDGNDTYVVDNVNDRINEDFDTGTDTVLSSITFSLVDNNLTVKGELENLTLTGSGAISGTGNTLANLIAGNTAANKLTGDAGNDTLQGGGSADTLDGGAGDDSLTGGAGTDRIIVSSGNDTVLYTSKLDGKDIIDGFDGNETDGQDVMSLDALFDTLGVAADARAGNVKIVDLGVTVEVRVNTGGAPDFDLFAATINTTDAITVGQDIIVGS
jgi:Ca2+-binding RTX toxin-like protein